MKAFEVKIDVHIETKILISAETKEEATNHIIRLLADESLNEHGDDRPVDDMIHKQALMVNRDENYDLMQNGHRPFGYYRQFFDLAEEEDGVGPINEVDLGVGDCVVHAISDAGNLKKSLDRFREIGKTIGGDTEVSKAIGCLHRFLNDISGEEK